MRQRATKAFLFLVLFPILRSAGYAQYVHTPPTGVDLVTYGGNANTLVVQIVNLTPYPIQYGSASASMQDQTDQDRKTKKQFMFAPVGVPQLIPAGPKQAFILPYLPNGQENPEYKKEWVNEETRPYSFVLSWDDKGGYVEDNSLTWTIKGVECLDYYVTQKWCQPTEDVELGLFVMRKAATPPTAGFYWDLVKTILSRALSIIAVVVAPESPRTWTSFFLGTGSVVDKSGFNIQQLTADDPSAEALPQNEKWYIAAFPIPSRTYPCYNSTPECTPTTDPGDDAIETQWSTQGGVVQQQIVVTTHLLRGHSAKHSTKEYYCSYDPAACRGELGSVPIAMVTIMTADEWLASCISSEACGTPAGAPNVGSSALTSGSVQISGGKADGLGWAGVELIRSVVQEHGREGLLTLVSILRNLPQQQREALRELIDARRAGMPITPQQQALVHMVAVRLRAQMK